MWKWEVVSRVLNSMGSAVVLGTIPSETYAGAPMFMLNSRDSVVVIEIICCGRGCVFKVKEPEQAMSVGWQGVCVYRFWQMAVADGQARYERRSPQMDKRNSVRAFSV